MVRSSLAASAADASAERPRKIGVSPVSSAAAGQAVRAVTRRLRHVQQRTRRIVNVRNR
jgi:hypothetical protein